MSAHISPSFPAPCLHLEQSLRPRGRPPGWSKAKDKEERRFPPRHRRPRKISDKFGARSGFSTKTRIPALENPLEFGAPILLADNQR